ncbi:hypothetical protein BH23CHL8_BH23CHL8_13390 [soil metagenome]
MALSVGASAQDAEPVTLSYLLDTTDVTIARAQALADAYTAQNPHSPGACVRE